QITLKEDLLTVQTAQLQAFGGKIAADGTTMRLAHPEDPFHVKVGLQNIDLAKGLALVSDKKVLSGNFSGDIALDGKTTEPELMKKTLAGLVQGKVLDGAFHGKDLVASVAGPLASKLPFGVAGKGGAGGETSLGKELPFGLQIESGRANLKQP